MRVLLKTVLDVHPDQAWRALRSPAVFGELYGPLLRMRPHTALPTVWADGSRATVSMSAFGIVPLGRQRIDIRLQSDRPDGVRIVADVGGPETGPLSALSGWRHRMAVAPAPGDAERTLYRDELRIGGPLAPLLWPALWLGWQLRASRLRSLASGWDEDSGPDGVDTAEA
ncbi:hypothetical protein [Mycetocola reblochoni]|uniref:SRPBCC family protein n=2 Tax=Mycetocola reblochoni TaxID=331618 RepID=A0A1R4ID76_9MICO|nr:hypothetical protein [Mycetocola reblochoni]RLP69101.1 hypothetical protein D9V30_07215 [Mycetocola reblochoni]SJN17770.1 hypothetical protein FM119_01145 [Mycetocola reblochoni REB411]